MWSDVRSGSDDTIYETDMFRGSGPCEGLAPVIATDAIMLAQLPLPTTTATTAPVGPCRLDPACMLATHVF
jgi:hypothetical protein